MLDSGVAVNEPFYSGEAEPAQAEMRVRTFRDLSFVDLRKLRSYVPRAYSYPEFLRPRKPARLEFARRGPVAQLDRAMRFERRGWEFKSLRVRHIIAP